MNVFDGIYSWDGKKHDGRDPIAWFPGAYNLKIRSLGKVDDKVALLKKHLCIFSGTGRGHSISANPEKFAKHICDDFGLEIERVLWVEQLSENPAAYEVVSFSKRARLGQNIFYSVSRREPLSSELSLITGD